MVIVCTLLALLLVVAWLNIGQTSKILRQEIEYSALEGARLNAANIDTWLDEIGGQLAVLAQTSDIQSMDWAEQLSLLEVALATHSDYGTFFIVDNLGQGWASNGQRVNLANQDFFRKVFQTRQVVYSEPLLDETTGELVIAVAAPIEAVDQLEPVGVVAVTVDLHDIQEMVANMFISGTGNGWIVAPNKVTVAHPVEEYWGNTKILEDGNAELRAIAERMVAGETGVATYRLQGVEKILAFAPVKVNGWSVAQGAEIDQVLAPVSAMRRSSVVITLVTVLLGIAVAMAIAAAVAKPVHLVHGLAEALAAGDLTQKVAYRSNDEIGAMAQALNQGVAQLRTVVGRVLQTADQVAFSSEELASSAEEVGQASGQVAETVSQLAKAADQQAVDAQDMSQVMEEVTVLINTVATLTEQLAQDSVQTVEVASAGAKLVEQTVGQMGTIETTVSKSAAAVDELGARSQEVGTIVEVIAGIADQTNLLALNAAIEAARAGEQGRGFAVVAEEVRQLAEQSRTAAQQIAQLIQVIQVDMAAAVELMGLGRTEVATGVESVTETGRSFAVIAEAVNTAVAQINQVSDAAQQLAGGSKLLAQSVEGGAATAEEAAAAAEEVSASSEEQSASAEEIAAAADELAKLSEELRQTVNIFKVD